MHNGHPVDLPVPQELRWIEIDLSDLRLSASEALSTPDGLAMLASHVYERFVPYADEGWEWVTHPGSRDFEGWVSNDRGVLMAARLLSRRAAEATDEASRAAHGVSAYRTRQLTGRPWTAEPGSKIWKGFS